MTRKSLHIFFTLAFLLSGISPACAFVSGKSMEIEICTADGLKTINIPVSNHEEQQHAKKTECAFCFAQTHLKTAKTDAAVIALVSRDFSEKLPPCCVTQPDRFELSSLSARAPPILL